MNSKNTWLWFVLAAGLFATICLLNRHLRPGPPASSQGWPSFPFATSTSVQVIPLKALEIQADRTNGNWFLSKPLVYPAQAAAIQALLDSLAKLTPVTRITANELREQSAAEQDYGFDHPAVSLVISAADQQWQLKIGRLTAPGDQVFLRIVGVDGAFVTDAGWLKYLPQTPADWRETTLVNASGIYDAIVLTNGAKVIELHLDPTNHLWRMTRPLQARADSDRINRALQQLRSARVADFVTDDPRADLSAYELQPASLDLWLGHGGGPAEGLHTGKTLTNNPALVYAKREGWNGIITTLEEPLSPWHGSVNDFRDTHLIDFTTPVNEVEVQVGDSPNQFTLQQTGTKGWQVAGETFPVDADNVQVFLKLLGSLKATDFVSDVATLPDLQTYGLAKPLIQITLRPTAGDTNHTLAQLCFSAPQTNGVFVRRSDEDFIYALDPTDLNRIPESGWEFRDRHIWNFPEQDITGITVHQNGQTRQLLHSGRNQWSLAPGSPGQIYPPTIEETAHQLGNLAAIGWVAHKISQTGPFGVTTNSLQVVLDLKNGEKRTLDFGGSIGDQPLGLVTLDGVRWAFIIPQTLYQLVLSYLTIPANGP
jgi:hypothetical protein